MTDIIKSIIDTAKERIKNPFIGTFIFAWLVFNWRPISVFLFSKHRMETRISRINIEYTDIYNFIVWPLLLAIVYMILIPSISLAFDWIMKKIHFKRKDFKNDYVIKDIELKTDTAIEEAKLEDAKANHKEKFDLNKQISDLKSNEKKNKRRIR